MRVLRRQATFWELGDDFPTVRIDFPRGSERRFDPGHFIDFAIVDTHPALNEYHDAWSRLSPVAPVSDPDTALAAVVSALSADLPWRSADRYLNPQFDPRQVLADGYGHLLEAPDRLVDRVCTALARLGIDYARLPGRPARPAARALIAGSSYVVAENLNVTPAA